MRKKIIVSITALLLSAAVAATALFAWFTSGKSYVSNIEFETGRIEMSVELYSVADFNRDGIPDYSENTENGLVLNDIINPPEGTLPGIHVANALPGQVFSYRLVAKNLSAKPSVFALSMTSKQSPSGVSLNDCFSFSASVNGIDYKIPLMGEKVILVDEPDASDSYRVPLIVLPEKSTLTFDFRLTFEHLTDLQSHPVTASAFAGKSNLNDYLARGFENCKFFFEFRQSENTAV